MGKKIRVTAHEECSVCHGTGAHSKNDVKTCSQCHGTGSVTVEQQSIFGRTRTQTVCPKCGGKGITSKNKEVEVKVPAGIDTGQQIRLEGYGHKGFNGGPAGDLYILFEVKKHEIFERHGDDVVVKMPV